MGATTWSWQPLQKHFNYHGALETSPQDKRGMNCLRVNAQIFFCVGTIIEGLFIISIIKWCQIPFNLKDKGKQSFKLALYFGEMWSDAQWGNKNLKKQDKVDEFISSDDRLFKRSI